MRRVAVLLLTLASPVVVSAGPPRVVFERVVAPPQALGRGADEIAIVRATGEPAAVEIFVETFLDQINQSRLLRARDARRGQGGNAVRIGIDSLSCPASEREGEGSTRDAHGNRVRRTLRWVDARCVAAVTLLTRDTRPLASFPVRGEGTSPRTDEQVTDDERRTAMRQAARYAAIAAAEQLRPRRVRESIELVETAPEFEAGMAGTGSI